MCSRGEACRALCVCVGGGGGEGMVMVCIDLCFLYLLPSELVHAPPCVYSTYSVLLCTLNVGPVL